VLRWLPAVQLLLLLGLTVLFTRFNWDQRIAAHFYRDGQGWYLGDRPLWAWLHDYGTLPGLVLTLAALITWLAGFYVRRLEPWRRPCLIVVLTTLLAAGLLVNAVLKQYWGRPRPGQTTEFGGSWAYRPVFPPGPPGKGASFPCGHCTMGFVFLSLAAFRRQSKALAYGGVAVGVGLGALLSAARIVQGAHFLSDTIWAFGIVGMVATALILYWPGTAAHTPKGDTRRMSPRRRTWITIGTVVAVAIIATGFMTRRPFYRTMVYPLDLSPPIETIRIRINTDPEKVDVKYAQEPDGRLKVDAHGFGWMGFDYQMGYGTQMEGTTLNIDLHIAAHSYFAELDHALTLILPASVKDRVKVLVNE
jgi:membrane-associated PAP2 superfamily phosphatase